MLSPQGHPTEARHGLPTPKKSHANSYTRTHTGRERERESERGRKTLRLFVSSVALFVHSLPCHAHTHIDHHVDFRKAE